MAALFAGLIARTELAAAWAAAAPEKALRLDGGRVDALAALSRARYLAGDDRSAEQLAVRGQRASALDVPSLRVLGWLASRRGDRARARAIFKAAGARSWRDVPTQLWLWEEDSAARNYDAAARSMDAVLRVLPPEQQKPLFSSLAEPLGYTEAIHAIAQRLALAPPWRAQFLASVAEGPRPESLIPLLVELRSSRRPPAPEEVQPLIQRLLSENRANDAFETWRAISANPRFYRDHIYDGDFAARANAPPFGWNLFSGVGFQGNAEPPASGSGQGLAADYDGFSPAVIAEQLLVLPPGRYRLHGEARLENSERNRLAWRLTCDKTGTDSLKASPAPASANTWAAFEAGFTIPQQSCGAQWFRLTGEPGERHSPTRTWFRRLRITAE